LTTQRGLYILKLWLGFEIFSLIEFNMEKKRADPEGEYTRITFIRDKNRPLLLRETVINGVTVFTPSPDKSRELDERFKRMVPEPQTSGRAPLWSRLVGRKK
jgi:hypothetical protein